MTAGALIITAAGGANMGEAADDMLEGRACQCCGQWLEEFLNGEEPDGFGYPVSCPNCKEED